MPTDSIVMMMLPPFATPAELARDRRTVTALRRLARRAARRERRLDRRLRADAAFARRTIGALCAAV